jgi:hypothetical protein
VLADALAILARDSDALAIRAAASVPVRFAASVPLKNEPGETPLSFVQVMFGTLNVQSFARVKPPNAPALLYWIWPLEPPGAPPPPEAAWKLGSDPEPLSVRP